MNYNKVGSLILNLRKEKGLTQKQLADQMHISDRTVSKWERGLGCPDVSLLHDLSNILEVNIEKILTGELESNLTNGGNMKKIKFYVCPTCGNVITSMSEADVSCCGRKLTALVSKPCDAEHMLHIETVEEDNYITFSHEMSKSHYLNFMAYVGYDRVLVIKLYPEQGSEVRFPHQVGAKIYFGCSQHGLFEQGC